MYEGQIHGYAILTEQILKNKSNSRRFDKKGFTSSDDISSGKFIDALEEALPKFRSPEEALKINIFIESVRQFKGVRMEDIGIEAVRKIYNAYKTLEEELN